MVLYIHVMYFCILVCAALTNVGEAEAAYGSSMIVVLISSAVLKHAARTVQVVQHIKTKMCGDQPRFHDRAPGALAPPSALNF